MTFFTEQYDFLVTYGPIVTIVGFLGFYAIFHYVLIKAGKGSKLNRYAFSLLFIALLPNFFAHLSLAIVHGAWSPFLAEIVNITPVATFIILNEYYLRKYVGYDRAVYMRYYRRWKSIGWSDEEIKEFLVDKLP